MATIAKISGTNSAHAAISYAQGKGRDKLKNHTLEWLETNGIDTSEINSRAVVSSGTNGIMPAIASTQMKTTRLAFNQDNQRNQALRIIQSFDSSELDPTKPADWQIANDIGQRLAAELYPDYQAAIYTHIDGDNHVLHNHIIVSKVNLETGKKLRQQPGEAVKTARAKNDEIAREMDWHILEAPKESVNYAEQAFEQKVGFSWRKSIKVHIDEAMTNPSVTNWDQFTAALQVHQITPNLRGKNVTFVINTNDGEHRVRGNKLGTDYEKETLIHGLERKLELSQRHEQTIEQSNTETNRGTENSQQRKRTFHNGDQAVNEQNRVYKQARKSHKYRQRTAKSRKRKITELSHRIDQFTGQLRTTIDRFKQVGTQLQTATRQVTEFIKRHTQITAKPVKKTTQTENKQITTTQEKTNTIKKSTNKLHLDTDSNPDELFDFFKNFNQQVNQELANKEQERKTSERQRKELAAKRIQKQRQRQQHQQSHDIEGPSL